MHDREGWEWLRCGDAFVAYASQAVVGRHEQVVSADVG